MGAIGIETIENKTVGLVFIIDIILDKESKSTLVGDGRAVEIGKSHVENINMVVGNGVVESYAVLVNNLLNLLLGPRSDRLVVATHTGDSEVVHTA